MIPDMYGYIYKITFPNGSFGLKEECFYIGQKKSTSIVETYFGSGKKVQDWFAKRGLNSRNCNVLKASNYGVHREILAIAKNQEELNFLEFMFIKPFLGSTNCLNLCNGGNMPKITNELKQKISECTRVAMKDQTIYKKYRAAIENYYRENHNEISMKAKLRALKTKNYEKMNSKNREKKSNNLGR